MPSSRWHSVQDALWEAIEREPAAREAFLTEYCAGDSELLAEVLALVEAHETAGDFLDSPAPSVGLPSAPVDGMRMRRLFGVVGDLTA
jgi:hypothetical protein